MSVRLDRHQGPVNRDPGRHSGAATFSGTRIAVRVLLDYLADGQTVADFCRSYPSVSPEQANAALEEITESRPRSGASRLAGIDRWPRNDLSRSAA